MQNSVLTSQIDRKYYQCIAPPQLETQFTLSIAQPEAEILRGLGLFLNPIQFYFLDFKLRVGFS